MSSEEPTEEYGHDSIDESSRDQPALDGLVASYFQALDAGESPEIGRYLARLKGSEEKAELQRMIRWVLDARRALPEAYERGEVVAGRFTLLQPLGQGGMGSVWRARDEKLGREVALKVLINVSSQNAETRIRQFEREARLLAQLDDPRIVAVHDYGHDGTCLYIAMAHVRGVSLDRVIRELRAETGSRRPSGHAFGEWLDDTTRPGEPSLLRDDYDLTVAAIAAQLTGALETAHIHGVLHRDLKPSNVMLTAGGWPVLVDFGLGGELGKDPGTLTRGLWGTPQYLAPEQAQSLRTGSDIKSDIYQLGLVLLDELLTLRRGVPESDPSTAIAASARGILATPREVESRIPEELDRICMRALAQDRTARYETAAQLRTELERFCQRRTSPGWRLDKLLWLLRRRRRNSTPR